MPQSTILSASSPRPSTVTGRRVPPTASCPGLCRGPAPCPWNSPGGPPGTVRPGPMGGWRRPSKRATRCVTSSRRLRALVTDTMDSVSKEPVPPSPHFSMLPDVGAWLQNRGRLILPSQACRMAPSSSGTPVLGRQHDREIKERRHSSTTKEQRKRNKASRQLVSHQPVLARPPVGRLSSDLISDSTSPLLIGRQPHRHCRRAEASKQRHLAQTHLVVGRCWPWPRNGRANA